MGMLEKITLFIFLFITISAYSMNVMIITNIQHPVDTSNVSNKVNIRYYDVNELHRIQTEMKARLRAQHVTKDEVLQLISQYQKPLRHAAEGIKYTDQYHVNRIPTIIFNNDEYRVLGQTNLNKAITEYQQWRSKKD